MHPNTFCFDFLSLLHPVDHWQGAQVPMPVLPIGPNVRWAVSSVCLLNMRLFGVLSLWFKASLWLQMVGSLNSCPGCTLFEFTWCSDRALTVL